MKIKVLALLLLTATIAGVIYAQEPVRGDVDQTAQIAAFQVWGPAAYAAKYAQGEGPWIYEVGFQSLFGGRIAVGRGASWQEAFDAAKAAMARPLPPPMGG